MMLKQKSHWQVITSFLSGGDRTVLEQPANRSVEGVAVTIVSLEEKK